MRLLTCVALLIAHSTALPADPPRIFENPFSRPQQPAVSRVAASAGERLNADGVPAIRAIMISNRQRLANVDGRVFKPGDTVYGFTLRSIEERSAVFEKNGRLYTVLVKPPIEDDRNEEPRG